MQWINNVRRKGLAGAQNWQCPVTSDEWHETAKTLIRLFLLLCSGGGCRGRVRAGSRRRNRNHIRPDLWDEWPNEFFYFCACSRSFVHFMAWDFAIANRAAARAHTHTQGEQLSRQQKWREDSRHVEAKSMKCQKKENKREIAANK